jgi:high-affinity Fe2+/Pb2+ permease
MIEMKLDQHFILSIFHLLFVVPLFLFIGFQRADTPQWVYFAILAIGAVILVYHGFKLIVRVMQRSGFIWINAIHVFLIAPLLLYIGWHKKETPRFAYELLLLLGFAAAGYHLFSLVRFLHIYPDFHDD